MLLVFQIKEIMIFWKKNIFWKMVILYHCLRLFDNQIREYHVCSNKTPRAYKCSNLKIQKKSPRGVLRKRCSENMQQIYKRAPMPKSDFNKSSPVNLLHIFRTPFPKNASGLLLPNIWERYWIFGSSGWKKDDVIRRTLIQ